MSYTIVLLIGTVLSIPFWVRRIVRFASGMSRAATRTPARNPGPGFEERIEAQLAELARAHAAREVAPDATPPPSPRPGGFGRKQVQPDTKQVSLDKR